MAIVNFVDSLQAEKEILAAVETGFIDGNRTSLSAIQPKLIYNNRRLGMTALSVLKEEIEQCKEFWFSIAFVNDSGLNALKMSLREGAERGVRGRILTTNYLTFNSPKALRELLKLKNVEVKITQEPLHTKGYRFFYPTYSNLIVGSSNLTMSALQVNKEWNIKLSSLENGAVMQKVDEEFAFMWENAEALTEEWICAYEKYYADTMKVIKKSTVTPIKLATLQPNIMQRKAMQALDELRSAGAQRGLLISATGTGKTYLSAFDVRSYAPKRVLFLAHREQLLIQAKDSFLDVLANTMSYGILSGTKKEIDRDCLFSTVQTLSKEEYLYSFTPEYFDYIIIDEVHRASATTYNKIVEYFKPKFMLGMTATPERSDDAAAIYELFEHNIAYEIRLQDAMEMDLLCPFHYYAVTDMTINNKEVSDYKSFNQLSSIERVRQILEKAEYYGYSGKRVKGLVFCNTNEVAKALALEFTNQGYPSIALSGANTQEERRCAIARLNDDQSECYLNYIFTVDIFNEGVDIPSINQIIMLRPTESAIIFVQQLGRGLRKNKAKDYVVVLDFIGNSDKTFLVPIALSGDRSYNKDNLRRYIVEGSKFLPGYSTINFSQVTKKKILAQIDTSNLNTSQLLYSAYIELKSKLGRIPTITDFEKLGSVDIQNFFKNSTYGSYYHFLVKKESTFKVRFTATQERMMLVICGRLSQGKRQEDLLVLQQLLEAQTANIMCDEQVSINVFKVLSNNFNVSEKIKKINDLAIFVKECIYDNGIATYMISDAFAEALEDKVFKMMVRDVVDYGLRQYDKEYKYCFKDTPFVLYKKYSYEEVCRLLAWSKNINSQTIGGYRYDQETNTLPVFINYHKDDDIEDSIKYEDRFINEKYLIALSKSNRKLTSPDIQVIQSYAKNNVKIYIFVRKNKDDKQSKEFYYLGTVEPAQHFKPIKMLDGSRAVEIGYILHEAVRSDIYEYLIVK